MKIFMSNISGADGNRLLRSLSLVAIIILLTVSSGMAQDKPQPKKETQVDRIMAVYVRRIQMTKEQQEKFRPVMVRHLEKQREIRVKYKNNRTMMRKEMMMERANMEKKLGEVVSPEQMEKYHKWQSSYKSKKRTGKVMKKTPESKTVPKPND